MYRQCTLDIFTHRHKYLLSTYLKSVKIPIHIKYTKVHKKVSKNVNFFSLPLKLCEFQWYESAFFKKKSIF